MKNKINIILIIVIILLIPILIIVVINELSRYHTYTVKITDIEDNYIIVEDESDIIPYKESYANDIGDIFGHKVNTEEGVYITVRNRIYTKDVKIKSSRGKKISNLDLNIGDTLYVVVRDDFSNLLVHVIENVKFIKVLE